MVAYDHSKAFIYRYRDRTTRKLKQLTIGDAGSLPISDAREQFARAAAAVRVPEVRELVAAIAQRAPDIAGRVLRELRAA